MLPEVATRAFKQLYLQKLGVDLSDEEASRRANNLVGLYKAVYGEPPNSSQGGDQIVDRSAESEATK